MAGGSSVAIARIALRRKRCANIFPGSYDWRDFACIVEASRIRKHVQKTKGPIDLTFRVNLANQTGTVEVDDVKVVPLAKAEK